MNLSEKPGSLLKYSHIIWDWNGTLLDDAWLCVDVMNGMLKNRNLPMITLEKYRSIFCLPVKDYYLMLGFDFDLEPFEVVGMEFMNHYNRRQKECSLHADVQDILTLARTKGYRQSILSAREENELRQEIIHLQVSDFFDYIAGLDDHYAHGKTDVGVRLLKEIGAQPENLLFIGDTLHDAEVANELGIECILIPNGHHSAERIKRSGKRMIYSLNELSDVF
jgi:phosphoglycolate phosphatase